MGVRSSLSVGRQRVRHGMTPMSHTIRDASYRALRLSRLGATNFERYAINERV